MHDVRDMQEMHETRVSAREETAPKDRVNELCIVLTVLKCDLMKLEML